MTGETLAALTDSAVIVAHSTRLRIVGNLSGGGGSETNYRLESRVQRTVLRLPDSNQDISKTKPGTWTSCDGDMSRA
ncbi:hypothetical protein ACPWSH_26025, partial [Pandoraea pneumonica]|uniref:hypothetical protein n=1 Tax=Pandoraea pneumonica TaxID=2508299 RepID=UPI003CEFA884